MTPIRKGSNPVKIPFAIKSSDPIFAAWANETRTAIRQLEARMPTANIGRGTGAGSKPPLWVTISAVPESSPVSYQAKVTTGYLCYQNATLTDSDSGVVGYLTPKITTADGELVSIESTGEADWVAPALPLDGLVNYIYLRVQTDSDGAPKEPTAPEFPGDPGASDGPTIVTFTEPQQSTHHVRDSPTSGEEDGDYYLLICETESNEAATPAPRVVRRITGNREMPNQLIEILNLGEEGEAGRHEVYKGYDKALDKHDLRTVLQQQTPGVAIIEPLAPAVDAVPPVVVDGTIVTAGSPAIPAEEAGDYIRWRTVDGRVSTSVSGNTDTRRQIEVRTREEDDEDLPGQKKNVIEVIGNDFTDSFTDVKKFNIGFNDGLIETFTKLASDDEGWWGTIQWIFYPSGGGTPVYIDLDFEAGLLKRVRQDVGSVGGVVDVPGTEAAPASIAHVTSDS